MMLTKTNRLALTLSILLGACTGAAADDTAATGTPAAEKAVQPTGTVIEVKMITDDRGNYFEPADVEARRGDVLRFVLVSGVHNVSFPGDLNPGAAGLPEASAFLQLPGQTLDLTVDVSTGSYGFQCDPHAALGMVGTLTVTD